MTEFVKTAATAAVVGETRYLTLDHWRGVACLLVLLNHAIIYELPTVGAPSVVERGYRLCAEIAERLWLGVPMFFVISGYCIAAAADGHRRKGAPVSHYFKRRLRRIFPPYWITVALMAVTVGVLDLGLSGVITGHSALLRPWWYSMSQWLGSLTLTETWRTHLTGGQKALVLGPAWTLCYEEQFYAVCGVLLWLWPRRFFEGALAVSVIVATLALIPGVAPAAIEGFFFDGRWLQFGLGLLLYYALVHGGMAFKRATGVLFVAVVLGALSGGSALSAAEKSAYQEYLVAGAFAAVALWLRPWDGRIDNWRVVRPLKMCGLMCYSLYLVHMPTINVIRALVAGAGVDTLRLSPWIAVVIYGVPSLALASWFHRTVERRFMSLPSPHPPVSASA